MSNYDAHVEHKAENLRMDAEDKVSDLKNKAEGKSEDFHLVHKAQKAVNNTSDYICDRAVDLKQGAINLKDKIVN